MNTKNDPRERRRIGSALTDATLTTGKGAEGIDYRPMAMMPDVKVLKIGGQSIMDRGRKALMPILDEVVPSLAAEVVGRPLAPQAPASFRVVAYRKGSWSRGPRACVPGAIGCTLGLGDDAWPTAWGGQSSPPVRGDQLTLYDPGRAPEVPVLLRHVERYELRTFLTPVAP